MARDYAKVLHAIQNECWAIRASDLEMITSVVALRVAGRRIEAEEIEARIGERNRPVATQRKGVAVLPLFGVIANRMNMLTDISGGTSTEQFTAMFSDAVADESVRAIVLDVDSPGGMVGGVGELSDRIYGARGTKPIIAIADDLMASAAYWIASAADEVWSIPSGEVGSIGVFAAHVDVSAAEEKAGIKTTFIQAGRFKTEANQHQPLGDDAREFMQEQVDAFYGMFVSAVARNRGVTASVVRKSFGEGRTFMAKEAKAVGMIDRIGTRDEVLGRLGVRQRQHRAMVAMAKAKAGP